MLSGASVRYRFYSRWGLTGEELSRIVFSYSVTFWLGLLALGGFSLAVSPPAALPVGRRDWQRRPGGCWPQRRWPTSRRPQPGRGVVRLGRYRFPLPPPSRRAGAAAALHGRVGAGRRGALRAAAARRGAVRGVSRRVPGRHPGRHGQPRARRAGGVRRADGPAAEAVPVVGRAAAGAAGLSRCLLPAAVPGGAGRAGRRRAAPAAGAGGARERGAGADHRADHPAAVRAVDLLLGCGAAVLGRDAGGAGPPAAAANRGCRCR